MLYRLYLKGLRKTVLRASKGHCNARWIKSLNIPIETHKELKESIFVKKKTLLSRANLRTASMY